MLLIELEGGSTPRYKLEFHPRLTIVAGLDEIQRRELAAGITAALRGDNSRRMKLQVDIANKPQALNYDHVFNLGLNCLEFDNVVTMADIPGHQGRGDAGGDRHDQAISAARRELDDAKKRVSEIDELVRTLSKPIDRISPEEVREAAARVSQAESRVERLTEQLHDMGASQRDIDPLAEVDRLTELRDRVQARIEELTAALQSPVPDSSPLLAAVLEAEANQHQITEQADRSLQMAQMAGGWSRITAVVASLERQPKPPEWLIIQTKDELDDITARIKALSYQLEEGIEVSAPLAKAKARMADVQASWDEIENGVAGQLAAAYDKRDELHTAIGEFLGHPVDVADIATVLETEIATIHEAAHPNAVVVDALALLGVESDVDDALMKAQIWLEGRPAAEAKRASDKAGLAVAVADLNDLKGQLSEAQALAAAPKLTENDFDALRSELEEATTRAHECTAEFESLKARQAQMVTFDPESLPSARQQLQLAKSALEAAERKVQYFTQAKASLRDPLAFEPAPSPVMLNEAALAPRPWWEGGLAAGQVVTAAEIDESGFDLDVYLLARAAAQRMMLPGGESLPLIIDGVLASVTPDVAVRTFEALAKIASVVQIVYLAESDFAEKWAKRQDIRMTAVVRLERA